MSKKCSIFALLAALRPCEAFSPTPGGCLNVEQFRDLLNECQKQDAEVCPANINNAAVMNRFHQFDLNV